MIKRFIATITAVLILMCTTYGSYAYDNAAELSKLSCTLNENMITVSLNGEKINNNSGKDINVIIAVYNGGFLADTKVYRVNAGEASALNDCTFTVTDVQGIKVKAFIWSADSNCTPIEQAAEISVDDMESSADKVEAMLKSSGVSNIKFVAWDEMF